MPSLWDIAKRHTELTAADIERLRLLLEDWQLLADLSFSDLLLWLPTWNRTGYVAAAQMRPTTAPTAFSDDRIGSFLPRGRQAFVDAAASSGRVSTGDRPSARGIPVPGTDRILAVIAQHTETPIERERSRLEQTYVEVADRLAQMISEGTFPAVGQAHDPEDSPRVGDGLILLDHAGSVEYASPNALSAYRRLGLAAELVGASLATTTKLLSPPTAPVEHDPSAVVSGRVAGTTEVESRGAVVALRSIPLLQARRRTGALLLLRDVSDLRRRERELVTKDATILEIHHRVKNNLQTVAALLRLQARRAESPTAASALAEAESRVQSIALVHETLSAGTESTVPFNQIADRLLAAGAEFARRDADPSAPRVVTERVGSFGELEGELATPLALVINELLHNAIEHGLRGSEGHLWLVPRRSAKELTVVVEDDGVGLPEQFDGVSSAGLGLQIARTLLADLGGQIVLGPRQAESGGASAGGAVESTTGTAAVIRVPLG